MAVQSLLSSFIQLFILFFVIFDPLASFAVFFTATKDFKDKERNKIVLLALLVASIFSFAVLILGSNLLTFFNTNIDEFRIAGGIILAILGVKMSLGLSLADLGKLKNNSGVAIAAIIGTPLLTGPATIMTIIIAVNDYGRIMTALAVLLVLLITGFIFYQAKRITKFVGETTIRVLSTVLGLITLSWGIKFVIEGIKNIFLG